MRIRRFKTGDEVALFQVFLSAVHGIAAHDYSPEQIQAWAPITLPAEIWASKMQTLRPWVLEIDNTIVAYADVQANGYIDHFFVAANATRKGLGSQLMQQIFATATHLAMIELSADVSISAEPFFLHHGFAVAERKQTLCRGVILQNALMRKKMDYRIDIPQKK
ncbi:GNAT family N-acetyltransferase [Deefgea piscis]|uniref:GNAT family N-acetyltransferase n=1 Tax=Deefgea piscis TaxID=2739061 RepID=A0A6M8SXJ3_9NEIS|nr:GNAT family N-acetyltransferase [Deefgea piscis]QKJ67299.1 GNAT family N-acetyltransferase [Deefgea piscis]